MEKQITELAELICKDCAEHCDCVYERGKCEAVQREASMILNAGYRKADAKSHGHWEHYSTTMMECSECKRHVPKHKYSFCPHCGSDMTAVVTKEADSWEQLQFNDI